MAHFLGHEFDIQRKDVPSGSGRRTKLTKLAVAFIENGPVKTCSKSVAETIEQR